MCSISETENATEDCNDLKEFINQSRARLKAVLERLQWTEEDVFTNYNTNAQSLESTEDVSELDTEPPLPESCATKNSVIIDPSELRILINNAATQIPQKFSDLQVNFTRDQKLQLYDYVIEHTEKSTETVLTDPVLNEGQMSFAEIVAQKKREGKNRRRHRTTKPTHIEEVRGLVDLQMQALQQYLENKGREERIRKREMESKRSRSRERRRESGHTYHRDKYRKRSRSEERDKHRRRRSKSRSRSRKEHKKHKRSRSRSRSRRGSKSRSHSRSRKEHKKHKRSRSRSRSRRGDKSRRYEDERSSRRRSHETSRSSNQKYENSKTHHHHRSNRDRSRSKHNSVKDQRR